MVPQTTDRGPMVRRGFWVAVVLGCLALLTALVNPLTGVATAAVFFWLAYGIKRGQAWAAIVATCLLLFPLVMSVSGGRQDAMATIVVAIDVIISCILMYMLARAALTLWRDPQARRPVWRWVTLLVVLGVMSVAVRPYMMSSGSMEPTLLSGDYVLFSPVAWKLGRAPHFGDVVMLRYPPDPKQTFTKRIVGLPGDRLHMVDKRLFRNGSPVDEPYAVHNTTYVDPFRDNFPAQPPEQLVSLGRDMLANHVRDGEVVVPPGEYFVLGDNRDNSLDSRYWGFISRDDILGSPVIIYGSVDMREGKPGIQVPSVFNTRWNRLLKVL